MIVVRCSHCYLELWHLTCSVFRLREACMSITSQTDQHQAETAQYIAGISKELRALAAQSGMDFIAYLLSMAEEEALHTARNWKGSASMKKAASRAS